MVSVSAVLFKEEKRRKKKKFDYRIVCGELYIYMYIYIYIYSVLLDIEVCASAFSLSLLFCFLEASFSNFMFHQWVSCTVYGIHKLLFSTIFFIKNGSHGTIHTFKNYFAIVFSIFSKINSIQMDP